MNMNDKNREALSAFLDGEISDPEAIEALVRQSGCQQNFSALCQQRDALQGQLNPHLPQNFAAQVALAIAEEPTVLSPAAARPAAVPLSEPSSHQRNVVQGWFGARAPSVAVAASVAALGFVGLVALNEGNKSDSELMAVAPTQVVPTVASAQLSGTPSLSVRQDAVRPVTADFRSIDLNSLSPQLRSQLVQHMELMRRSQQASGGAQSSNISFQPSN